MRKNFGSQTWLYPMPVLIIGTYDENGKPNVMNAAWGGIYDTGKIFVCIDPSHKTAANMLKTGSFTVSIGNEENLVACDYVGIVSGNDEPNKVTKAGFTAVKSEFVNAPCFEELPMTLECKMLSFDDKTGCTTGEIVNINADENILDGSGKISLAKFTPLCYDPVAHNYVTMGTIAGKAFADGKKLIDKK